MSPPRFQDTLVRRLVELNGHGAPLREPRLVFTAGAMGVGKSHVIRWGRDGCGWRRWSGVIRRSGGSGKDTLEVVGGVDGGHGCFPTAE